MDLYAQVLQMSAHLSKCVCKSAGGGNTVFRMLRRGGKEGTQIYRP